MDRENIKGLLNKFKAGTASAEEKAFLELWYSQYKDAEGLEYQLADRLGDANEIWAGLPVHETQVKRIKLWPRIAVAAAAVAVIVSGLWVFNYRSEILRDALDDKVVNDVAPGKNGATIALGNGKVIQLSDAKTGVVVGEVIKYDDGTALSGLQPSLPKGERSMVLTASTDKGQTYQFTLPDGTKVWLNADSKLEFPSKFDNVKQRVVKLSGEGYFEVAKVTHIPPSGREGRRPERVPFIVSTEKQEVEVLGTHFNINSYNDEDGVKTTLLEGSVKISTLFTRKGDLAALSSLKGSVLPGEGGTNFQSVILKPNEQSSLNKNHIKVSKIDPELAIAWKNNQFIFESDDIRYIMRMIARWYNVEVVYNGELPGTTFSGAVSRFENVSEVLRPLQATGQVKFKIEGRRIMVSK
jgi:ferric-dicitrate binding protein FerR (iron transport regulator)